MKKKNKKNKNGPEIPSDKLKGKLKRHQERLAREEQKKEKSRNALFRRRVREASEKKAPKTLRTKSYYRFSKEYPSAVTPDGFRENKPEKEKLSAGKKLLAVICCIAVFCLSFLAIETAFVISERDISDGKGGQQTDTAELRTAVHFTADKLRNLSAQDILSELDAHGADTAVFEFKDEYGYVYFDINSFTGASADRRIPEAETKLRELKENGISCIAYISCFRDTAAASSLAGACLKNTMGSDFIAADGSAWLDPFAEASVTYLTDIIKKAAEAGFDNILLDNVCFPPAGNAEPGYSGDASSAEKKNAVLIDFINKASSEAGKDKIIVMSLISGINQVTDAPSEKYSGLLTSADCEGFAVDLRTASQNNEITENSHYFSYVDEMPEVFILDALSLAKTSLKDTDRKLTAIVDSTLTETEKLAEISDIYNIIYW
ncbi:MAG: hypothetical protein IJA39_02235 [Clostridia bacterium]|nr:hypothetical protein [Clostridia bacterium]